MVKESNLIVEADGKLKKRIQPVRWFWGALLFVSLIVEWVFDMAVQIVQVIHGGMEGAAKALQRKYNEFNN